MAKSETSLRSSRFLIFGAVCLIVAALYFARAVLIPVALAVLISFLLAPVVLRLERAGLHRGPSVVLVVTIVLALVAVLGWVVYAQMLDLAERLPSYKDDIAAKIRSIVGGEPGSFGKAAAAIQDVTDAVTAPATQSATAPTTAPAPDDLLSQILKTMETRPPPTEPTQSNPVPVRVVPEKPSAMEFLRGYIGDVTNILAVAGIVLVFVIFMLIQHEDLRDRVIRLVGFGQLQITTQALDDAATRISRFLLAQAIVNGTYGLAISVGLWLIGYFVAGDIFPNFVLWGLLCAVLRFIPYVGPWIAAAFPIALAFAVYPGYRMFVAVSLMFIVVELLSNNVMEPLLYGSRTGMSTLAVLVSAVFWTWLWGPIGLVMSTPLTVCLVVVGKHVPPLRFFDVLLGDQPVLAPPERVYQRLLASDQEEASEILEELLRTEPLEEIFDSVLLPALALAEQDRHAGRLEEDRSLFIRNAMRELIEELVDQQNRSELRQATGDTALLAKAQQPSPSKRASHRSSIPRESAVSVVVLPAHDEADEIVGVMLAALLDMLGYSAFSASQTALASEMIEQIETRKADIVCVSALPPAAQTHARYLCKRLHARFPEIDTVVGLWTVRGDLRKLRQRIMCSGSVTFATTLAQAMDQIHELAQSKIHQSDPRPAAV